MTNQAAAVHEVPNFYTIQPLNILRRTPGVSFDSIPMDLLPRIDAIDRVIHHGGAYSPGSIGTVTRPWYVHPHQVDNLLVLQGTRTVEIYHPDFKLCVFDITPDAVHLDGKLLVDGPAMLSWQRNVFHRVHSCPTTGSASLNIAVRDPEFDLATNFSIYDLDTTTGAHQMIRAGHLDQPSN